MKKESGSVGNLMVTGLCVLAMTALMICYVGNARLVYRKAEVSQVARKYILRMETTGELTDADRIYLIQELEALGVTGLDLSGTTMDRVHYGEPIVLMLSGKLEGEYDIREKRVSTAKN